VGRSSSARLRRVETPSGLGAWSYEVTDTKLARETKGNTVLQLSLYSDLLATMQQRVPETAHVVTPGTEFLPETYRIADFAAFYRRIRRNLETFAAAPRMMTSIRTLSSTAKSADGARPVLRGDAPTITCRLSQG
jgi:hypothetical protein